MFTLDANIGADVQLSQAEINYLKHVEDGKIEPLTLKEKVQFVNNLLDGHNIKMEDDALAYGYRIKLPKKVSFSGRPKGKGRGKSTKRKEENIMSEVSIDAMPKSWAALFGK